MKPPLIFLIAITLIALLATRQFIRQRQENAANVAAPIVRVDVVIKSTRAYLSPDRRSRQREQIPVEDQRYEATFQPVSGDPDFTLRLGADEYAQLERGSRGELKRQGTRFVSFVPYPH